MKILLIGDPMTDINYFCKPVGLCLEAPVPLLAIEEVDSRDGGALNVKANLEAQGAKVDFIPSSSMSLKHRLWSGDRLVARFDQDGESKTVKVPYGEGFDAIVISDYQKGDINFYGASVPVFVDSKNTDPDKAFMDTIIFPNETEWEHVKPEYHLHVIRKAGRDGCFVDSTHIPTVSIERADTVGAGDTFLAAFVVKYLETKELLVSAHYANKAAGIACQRRGTAVVSREDCNV